MQRCSSDALSATTSTATKYRDDAPITGHQHVRRVTWFGRMSRSDLPGQARQAIGAPMAVFKPGAQDAVAQAVSQLVIS